MQHTLVILHSEEEYAYSLMNYMNQHKDFAFKVVAFTRKELCLEYAKKHKIHVLLFDDNVLENELVQLQGISSYYLSDTLGLEEYQGKRTIFMYQSAELIINQINQNYTTDGNRLPNRNGTTKTKLYAVCGMGELSVQLAYGLHLAKELSKEYKVLFISFQPFVNGSLYQLSNSFNLSEAIYSLKMETDNFSTKMNQWISHLEKIDCLLGVEHYSDLNELTGDDAIKLLNEVVKCGIYNSIVLDLPLLCSGATTLLSQCEVIYELSSEDEVGKKMSEEFHRQLELKEGATILSHIIEVTRNPTVSEIL